MRGLLTNFIFRFLGSFTSLFFLISCSAIDRTIHPDEKPAVPRPTYEELLKQNYRGPKARAVIVKFTDKSTRKETSRVGDGMAEMLRNSLLATNRYIVQARKSSDEGLKNQESREGRNHKEEETDLLVEGVVKEFKHGIPGAGDETGGTSYVTIVVTVTDPKTNQSLATEKMIGKATDFAGTPGRRGGLPEVFKDFSRTPMEKAIRIVIEESASFIVAKTPPDAYRVLPAPPKETPKAASVSPKVTPPPPPHPPLPTTQVVWDSVNLRKGPGTNYKIVGQARKGTSLKILESNGDWLRVRLEDGSTAWVSRLATSDAPRPPSSPSPSPPPTVSIQPAPM